MNTVKINVVRILALIGSGICLKLALQEEPFIDISIIFAKLLFGVVPIWVVAYYWSKAETMHSEYQREIKKEEQSLSENKTENENIKYIYIEKKKSGIGQLIIILAAIATILVALKEFSQ